MKYEEKTVFPYVESLIAGKPMANYAIDMYSKHHGQESMKLRELKSIIIKYFPGDSFATTSFQPRSTIYIIMRSGWRCMPKWRTKSSSQPSSVLRINRARAMYLLRFPA